jgi:putative Holliday junction resolvase
MNRSTLRRKHHRLGAVESEIAETSTHRMSNRHPAGRVMGLDVGGRRIGVAVSDETWLIATPLQYVTRGNRDLEQLRTLVERWQVGHIVVGLPTGLSGREGPQAADVRAYGDSIGAALGLSLDYSDERFTSAIAEQSLIAAGRRREERRDQIDAVSAAVILQGYLDARRLREERRAAGRVRPRTAED